MAASGVIRMVEVVPDEEVIENKKDKNAAPILSKSWSVASSHVPTFSGGKVTLCQTAGLPPSVDDGDNEDDGEEDGEEEENKQSIPFILLPIDGDLAIVDAKKGTTIRTLRNVTNKLNDDDDDDDDDGLDGDAIVSYALSPNDITVITCSRNQLLQQYSLSSSSKVEKVKLWGRSGHTMPVSDMEFHSSGVFLATASVDGSVRIWDARGQFITHVFREHSSRPVTCLRWSSAKKELVVAIGRQDGSIVIHDLRSKENTKVLHDHDSAVTACLWAGAGLFFSTGRDSVLNTWKNYQRIYTKPLYEQVEGMVLLPSESDKEGDIILATAGSKGSVRLWKASANEGKFELHKTQPDPFGEEKGGYLGLKFTKRSHDDEDAFFGQGQLVVADAEHNLRFLSTSALSLDRTVVGNNDEILDLQLLPSNQNKVVVATNSAQVRLFDLTTWSCEILDGHTATVLCVNVSPCGRIIATTGKDKTTCLWWADGNKKVATATGHTEAVGACCLSKKIGRYDVSGKAAVNGGGAFVVTASKDRTLKRWNLPGSQPLMDAAAGEAPIQLKTFCSSRAHEKDINIVSVAPNDSLVATGSQDKTIKLWKSNDLSLQATLKGHKRGVWDCQFSPYDRVLASSSGDRTIKLWSLGSDDYPCVRTFQGHLSSVLRVRFLNGGLQLVSSGADGLIKLWTIRTNECEATMDGHANKVWALDLAANGKQFITGGADSRIVVWNDTTKEEEDEKRASEEQNILLEQQLANHLRYKEFEKALEIALNLEKPMQVLKVLNALVENEVKNGRSGLAVLQAHAKEWPDEKIFQILKYCRDWNTRARNSHIAMMVVQALVTSIPAHKLSSVDGLPEILAGITPYAERHFDRIDRLHTSSYLLDFALGNMGSLDDDIADEQFAAWEASSKLVLPPTSIDGRIQVGGTTVLGRKNLSNQDDDSDNEVVTIGESDDSSDEEMEERQEASSSEGDSDDDSDELSDGSDSS